MKELIRSILIALQIPLTKNIYYDILTKKLMKKVLKNQSNCIDIGGFKGEITDEILKFSPKGQHFIFEPIPDLFKNIEAKFKSRSNISVINLAVSDKKGTSTFRFVPNFPAYSGLKKRDYPDNNTEVKEIEVKTDRLEDVIPNNVKIDFIKIDVEGAEFLVLSGAKNILLKSKPVVVFEYGLGASDFYGTDPEMMFNYFKDAGYGIFLLNDFIKNKKPLDTTSFNKQYHDKLNYYFVAAPV